MSFLESLTTRTRITTKTTTMTITTTGTAAAAAGAAVTTTTFKLKDLDARGEIDTAIVGETGTQPIILHTPAKILA